MPEATVMVADVVQRSGEKNGRPWTMTKIVDGNGVEYPPTFDKKLAVAVLALKGKRADIGWDGDMEKGKLTHATEHVERKAGGSRFDDPVVQHRITVLACMKVASETVNAEAAPEQDVAERIKRIKTVASLLAVWVDEYAERAANPPFSDAVEDDGIPFGEPEGG